MMQCDRPNCIEAVVGDELYCSDQCYSLDNDDQVAVTVLARNKAGGFGRDLHWQLGDYVPVSVDE